MTVKICSLNNGAFPYESDVEKGLVGCIGDLTPL